MDIKWTKDKAAAEQLVAEGYEAVECSFGHLGSVMGSYNMDHHGTESHREGVAVRAYRDHFGARKADQRFVVTGAADADATFAIAALAGLLPHPSRMAEVEKAPPQVVAAAIRDLSTLAEMVNRVDTAPIGVRCEETEEGTMLLLWNAMSSSAQDETAFHAGVDRWRALLGSRPLKSLLSAAKAEEAERVAVARTAEVEKISDLVAIIESPAWGFDVWYAEVAPIVVAYVKGHDGLGNVTIGCPDTAAAEKFFGPGGLKNVFQKLEPEGWGGREAIGGSPRGARLTREQAVEAARVIASVLEESRVVTGPIYGICDGYCPEWEHEHRLF